ncbi:hypothetical protein [Falsarthrobacter nasiphocae]|uniref:Uncharacterized protein n=1 Tax=Falsarthrobacter nasiphocae TaxID=189863 RepID=A0AAE3YGD1_9MICC|nr:hypothetical protein [Falsarthrobacter nasiphocae]MDR6891521.1 hypothetical protein [Falsarthrobacter nasiphocae]
MTREAIIGGTTENGTWEEEFVLELRLDDVTGKAIGDALAVVRSHCEDTGETPYVAFGDPQAYARSLEFRDDEREPNTLGAWARALWPVGAMIAGFAVTPAAVSSLASGVDMAIRLGAVLSVAWGLVFLAVAVKALRVLLQNRLLFVTFVTVVMAGLVGFNVLARQEIAHIPAGMGLGVGIVLLGVGVVAVLRQPDDLVTEPLTGGHMLDEDSRAARIVSQVVGAWPWFVVFWVMVLSVAAWLTASR